ncbi:MAG: hypothetical protein J6A01_08355 [Proteobacteria bacterium]|nr:hypothetical protein [Pseudomonadota bacterium]
MPSSHSLPIPPSQSDGNWLSNDPMQSDSNWLSNDPMQLSESQDPTLGTLFLNRKKFNLGMIFSLAYGAMFLIVFATTLTTRTQSFSTIAIFIPFFLICLALFAASLYYSKKKIWIDVNKEYLIIDCSLHHNGKRTFFLRNPRDTQVIIELSSNNKSRSYNVYLSNGKQKTCVGSWLQMNNAVQLKTMMDTLLMAQL